MTEVPLPIGLDLTRTGRVLGVAFDRALAEAGGSLAEWQVLMNLAGGPGGTQRSIAAAIGIEGATLTHHLNRMEAAGLVERRRDPADRRSQKVDLTAAGRARFGDLLHHVIAFDTRLRAGRADDEVERVQRILARLRSNVSTQVSTEEVHP